MLAFPNTYSSRGFPIEIIDTNIGMRTYARISTLLSCVHVRVHVLLSMGASSDIYGRYILILFHILVSYDMETTSGMVSLLH